jgi:predicted DNA-binding transcriptional regulator AlpA
MTMSQLLKREEAANLTAVCAKQVKQLIENEGFPRPVRVLKSDRWVESEIRAWIDQKIAERDAALAGGAA